MSRITDELSKYGCDMNTTLERFLGVELVEPLRNGMIDGLSPTYERLIAEKKTYDNIVNG